MALEKCTSGVPSLDRTTVGVKESVVLLSVQLTDLTSKSQLKF